MFIMLQALVIIATEMVEIIDHGGLGNAGLTPHSFSFLEIKITAVV